MAQSALSLSCDLRASQETSSYAIDPGTVHESSEDIKNQADCDNDHSDFIFTDHIYAFFDSDQDRLAEISDDELEYLIWLFDYDQDSFVSNTEVVLFFAGEIPEDPIPDWALDFIDMIASQDACISFQDGTIDEDDDPVCEHNMFEEGSSEQEHEDFDTHLYVRTFEASSSREYRMPPLSHRDGICFCPLLFLSVCILWNHWRSLLSQPPRARVQPISCAARLRWIEADLDHPVIEERLRQPPRARVQLIICALGPSRACFEAGPDHPQSGAIPDDDPPIEAQLPSAAECARPLNPPFTYSHGTSSTPSSTSLRRTVAQPFQSPDDLRPVRRDCAIVLPPEINGIEPLQYVKDITTLGLHEDDRLSATV